MRTRLPAPLLHVFFCLTFLALPYVFAPGGLGQVTDVLHNPPERTSLISYGLLLGFFYLNSYVLIPRLYVRQRYPLYALSVAGCFALILALLVLMDRQDMLPRLLPGTPPPPDGGYPAPVSGRKTTLWL